MASAQRAVVLSAHPRESTPAPASRVADFWRAFAHNRGALTGLALVVGLVALALGADVVAPHSPIE
jgi:dipeptide transport system permease protein